MEDIDMSGIAVLLPNSEMCEMFRKIVKEDDHVILIKEIKTEEAVSEARKAVSQGANIIIARGRQAVEIKKYTNIPLAEISITAQELGLLVKKSKEIVGKSNIKIGVFGWGDMICDTSHFYELYGVVLNRYKLNEKNDWNTALNSAIEEHVDIVIGGNVILQGAKQKGIAGLFLTSTEESLSIAIKNAKSMYYMYEIEQRNYAQFTALLDSSFNGIIKVGTTGNILVMNRAMEQMVGTTLDKVIGKVVTDLLKDLDKTMLEQVLAGQMENYSTFTNIGNQSLVIVTEPIVVEGEIEGAIISCNRMKRLDMNHKNQNADQYLRGYVAYETFEDVDKKLKGMREVVERAKLYAQSPSPMLIESISCPELTYVCQGIHNYSLHKNGPFIMINMAGMTEDQQMRTLFGVIGADGKVEKKGAFEEANHGTLVIQSIDKLSLPTQYNLVRTIRSRKILQNEIENVSLLDIKIIACTAKNLAGLRQKLAFRSDLFYMLRSLTIRIPSLLERKEDLEYLLTAYTKQYMDQYSRFHVMTAGAKQFLLDYQWQGTSIQLESFCERMILTASKRTITEEYVRSLVEELYECDEQKEMSSKVIEYGATTENPFATLLRETLQKYHGNRKLTAKALNMSTTTLWRRLKKYGMEDNLEK